MRVIADADAVGDDQRMGFGTVETLRRTFGRTLQVNPSDYRERFAA
jgi:transcriptional regulator GlxA family with amidase domain